MDVVSKLDVEVRTHETKVETWATACQAHVADEIVENEMARVRADNTRGGIPLATEEALAHYEDTFRQKLDTASGAEATILDIETTVLREAITEAIASHETLHSERAMYGTSTEKALLAGVLEETITARIARECSTMTVEELGAAYARWTDESDRTAVRLVEDAVTTRNGLERLGLRPGTDLTETAVAVQALQRAVAARRRGRVPAALHDYQARLARVWTLPRTHLRLHLAEGRGIARRPGLTGRKLAI